jgi:hypothetical protein
MYELSGLLVGECATMKHPDAHCDCGPMAASPLALRWRCPVCGKTAIMKVSILAADYDGDTIRKVEHGHAQQRQ